jgi:hypothetical protein
MADHSNLFHEALERVHDVHDIANQQTAQHAVLAGRPRRGGQRAGGSASGAWIVRCGEEEKQKLGERLRRKRRSVGVPSIFSGTILQRIVAD